jgi:hypothetical protein
MAFDSFHIVLFDAQKGDFLRSFPRTDELCKFSLQIGSFWQTGTFKACILASIGECRVFYLIFI